MRLTAVPRPLAATLGALSCLAVMLAPVANASVSTAGQPAGAALDSAITRFVMSPGGPPGIAVVVDRGSGAVMHAAGTSAVGASAPAQLDDHMRLASVSKAFSGAVALSLVRDHVLSLQDTVGKWLPMLPRSWGPVTLAELLNHTSGVPDFSQTKGFGAALTASPLLAPPPADLLSFVSGQPVAFKPGTRYHYSNSDNVLVALIAQVATGRSYESLLMDRVFVPFGLANTSLPRDVAISAPLIHGYQVAAGQQPEDATYTFAAGWAWASGGVNATPADADRFIRAYARGLETDPASRSQQFRFVNGASSEPPGPGTNKAGLGLFEYTTRCGTVYGHTGNTAGYTQFVAATRDGARSVVVSVNAQITPKGAPEPFAQLRTVDELAVCAALTGK